ncbi:MAG: HlyD family secretion protein [Pseudomonadota bacterium]
MTHARNLVGTLAIVAVAIALLAWRYSDYIANPWTRAGQVAADLVLIAPQVSGPIVEVAVSDNQLVKAGDLLFRIDPRPYDAAFAEAEAAFRQTENEIMVLNQQIEASQASVEQYRALIPSAESQLRAARATREEAERNLERVTILLDQGTVPQTRFDAQRREYAVDVAAEEQAEIGLLNAKSALTQAQATLAQAIANRGAPPPDNARLNRAAAALETARLNVEYTEVRASVDGYLTNLSLRLGDQAVAHQPLVALIDTNSYWIDAYFRETFLADIAPGNPAVVTLMGYPGQPIEGVVESINWGIAPTDGTTGAGLLPNVRPTFEWIRLAQRVPVKVRLTDVPEDVKLVVGTTASVLVRTSGEEGALVAAPSFLQ